MTGVLVVAALVVGGVLAVVGAILWGVKRFLSGGSE